MDRSSGGGSNRCVFPSALERFADQPWLRTKAVGRHPEPAQQFRSTRFYQQQHNHGIPFEKFTEGQSRVNETDQPDGASLIIAEGIQPPPSYRGIPP